MIIVSKPSKPFQYTAKSTPRRQTIINEYEEEINALYDAIADSSQSEISAPRQWDLINTLDFVRSVVGKVLPQNVDDTADIFQSGCDRLVSFPFYYSNRNITDEAFQVFKRHGSVIRFSGDYMTRQRLIPAILWTISSTIIRPLLL